MSTKSNYVLNPTTGRAIKIGGQVYLSLQRNNLIGENNNVQLNQSKESKRRVVTAIVKPQNEFELWLAEQQNTPPQAYDGDDEESEEEESQEEESEEAQEEESEEESEEEKASNCVEYY